MDVTETLDADCTVEQLFEVVADLAGYAAWLGIVAAVEPGPDGEAWLVELRGRIGPLARSKRLRMECTVLDVPGHVRFERRELDGRDHAPWVLDVRVEPVGATSRVTMHLHYGGNLAGAVLQGVLRDEIQRSRPRLRALAEARRGSAD